MTKIDARKKHGDTDAAHYCGPLLELVLRNSSRSQDDYTGQRSDYTKTISLNALNSDKICAEARATGTNCDREARLRKFSNVIRCDLELNKRRIVFLMSSS